MALGSALRSVAAERASVGQHQPVLLATGQGQAPPAGPDPAHPYHPAADEPAVNERGQTDIVVVILVVVALLILLGYVR
ncbi:MAG: hypothetical protein ABIQ32_12905 [Sphingomicrobium sp.]